MPCMLAEAVTSHLVIMRRYECKQNLPVKHYNTGVVQKSLHTTGNTLNIANKVTLVPPCISPNI